MRHRTRHVLLAALALVALAATLTASALAAPKSPNPGKGHGHAPAPGIHPGVSKPKGGTTVLTVDPTTVSALTGVAITPFGTATGASPVFTLPITGGSVVYKKANHGHGKGAHKKLLSGNVLHAGSGLTLTKAATTATISDLRINLSAGKTGRIDATLPSGKLKLATLSNVTVNATDKSVSATATLTPAAVSALNATFATTLPATGAPLGTLVITPTF
jgi:hypothetical protein